MFPKITQAPWNGGWASILEGFSSDPIFQDEKKMSVQKGNISGRCAIKTNCRCSGLCGTHSIGTFFFCSIRPYLLDLPGSHGYCVYFEVPTSVCGTELSSQIHLTLSTNHSLILLIIQSLAQLCIPGFQFSIFVSRSQTPAGKNKSNNTNLCSREIVNLDPLPNQSFSNVNLLVFWLLVFWAALLQNGQSLSTIYMYMALG